MRLAPLALGWLLVGFGCAAAVIAERRSWARLVDAILVLLFWPLYGPFFLVRVRGADPAGPPASPLGALLPDPESVRLLERRLAVATARVAEIDTVLARPDFAAEAASPRMEELRQAHVRRLRGLRDRFIRELDEVGQLLCQVKMQVEVVRLAGAPDEAARDLVRELVARMEGLDQMLRENEDDGS